MKGRTSLAAAFFAGALFAVGLAVSGMTRPAKVVGFLDVAGAWDASLAFVMVGAIAVHAVLARLVLRRPTPLFDTRFHLPTRRDLDARLILGAALFGIGWGLAGYCPGPALVTAATSAPAAVVFVLAMGAGMALEHATVGHGSASTAARAPNPAGPSEAPTTASPRAS